MTEEVIREKIYCERKKRQLWRKKARTNSEGRERHSSTENEKQKVRSLFFFLLIKDGTEADPHLLLRPRHKPVRGRAGFFLTHEPDREGGQDLRDQAPRDGIGKAGGEKTEESWTLVCSCSQRLSFLVEKF